MTTVAQLLQAKGHQVWAIGPEACVYDALELMAAKDIGALLVLEQGRLIGILSERDYARKVVLKGKSSKDTPVCEIMTDQVYSIGPAHTIEECLSLMTEKRVRHFPVLDRGQLVGVISIGDVVKALLLDRELLIQQLEEYIVGPQLQNA